MKALVIGASGDIGKGVCKALEDRDADIIRVGHTSGDLQVDISSTESIKELYEKAGPIDAVICAPASKIPVKPVSEMSKEDFIQGFQYKFLGQIDLVLTGLSYINEGGSFTLTTGILNTHLIPGGSCISAVNSAVEGFVRNAALELPKNLRLNTISPQLLTESAEKYKDHLIGFDSMPSKKVALGYLRSIYGIINAQVVRVGW